MAGSLKKGDKVAWSTPRGKTEGVVEKKITTEIRIKGHTARPSKENPEFLVKSARTGAKAAHKPEELKKV